jgi:chemotaxis protein methyltransferase CheR
MAPITEPDFQFIRQLVYDQSNIRLDEEKKAMVCSRLHRRIEDLGLAGVGEYCALLKSRRDPEEVSHLIDAVATHFTSFFREIEHFKFIKDTVVPAFRDRATKQLPTFRAWSAACATGEEPYSLAMLLAACFGTVDPVAWSILATDISAEAIDTARRGIYPESRVKLPNRRLLPRYFQVGRGEWFEHYRVKGEIRAQVEFQRLNLLEPGPGQRECFHLILCRNVMIYFDPATVDTLAARLCRQLEPGGYLILGHSEQVHALPAGLRRIKPSIYRREA